MQLSLSDNFTRRSKNNSADDFSQTTPIPQKHENFIHILQ